MSHIALYRAWRPRQFRDIMGQPQITQTLQNALKAGRLTHAYLFCGPRGTGKTSAAKLLAKAVNCEKSREGEPCGECGPCRRIAGNAVMDVIEIDAASNRGVEEIRDIRDKVKYAPTEVSYKVYIIDEVHMLTTEAFNALLKTLEEPPAHVIFILATTEPHRLPATIISRCQRFDFRRISLADQIKRMEWICEQEQLSVEKPALDLIARLSEGGMRDALSLLDQIASYCDGTVTLQDVVEATGGLGSDRFRSIAEAIADQDVAQIVEIIDELMNEGKSPEKALENLIRYFRDLLVIRKAPGLEEAADRILDPEAFRDISDRLDDRQLFQYIDELNRYHAEMKYAAHPKTLLEIALLKLCTMDGPASASASAAVDAQSASSTVSGTVAGSQAGGAPSADTMALQRRVDRLEQQLAALTRQLGQLGQLGQLAAPPPESGSSTRSPGPVASAPPTRGPAPSAPLTPSAPPTSGSAAGSPLPATSDGSSLPVQPADTKPSPPAATDATSPPPAAGPRAEEGTAGNKAPAPPAQQSADFKQLCLRWPELLNVVKGKQITVHAWLVNGEPVAVQADEVWVAFKNTIHRETTEKPANKQLIEQSMQELFGQPYRLKTLMRKEWETLRSEKTIPAETQAEEAESFKWEPEDPEAPSHEEDWINEAIQLFGEDLVEIKDE